FQPRRRQIKQRQPASFQVPGGQPVFDRVLPGQKPVHGRINLVGGRGVNAQVGAERGIRPPAGGGQFRRRRDRAGDDQPVRQVPFGAIGSEQVFQPQL